MDDEGACDAPLNMLGGRWTLPELNRRLVIGGRPEAVSAVRINY